MPNAALKVRATSDGRDMLLPTTGHREAAGAIVQAICLGRPIVGVIASPSTTTGAVLDAALADLASRGARIFYLRRTTVSCLGSASSMDRLKVSEMTGKGTASERSRQIAECLKLLGRPVPGETRRLLVIEEAEGVAPELLASLACMPALDHPALPLQLLCVGSAKHWSSLSASREGAAGQRIGSPIILLEAAEETGPTRNSRVVSATGIPAPFPRKTSTRRRGRGVVLAGLAILGCGGLLVAGVANKAPLLAFIEAQSPRLEAGGWAPAASVDGIGHGAGASQAQAVRPASPDDKAGGQAPAMAVREIERSAPSEAAPARIAGVGAPTSPAAGHGPPPQDAGPPSTVQGPAPDQASASRLIGMALGRGDAMLALHDLSAARRYYELAAGAGSANAALVLGRTYDPTSMIRSAAVSGQPDKTLAVQWYRRAAALGSSDAEMSLRNLERQQPD